MVTGNSAGFGGSQRPKFKKKGVKGNWNFWRGGVFKVKTSMGGYGYFLWNHTMVSSVGVGWQTLGFLSPPPSE